MQGVVEERAIAHITEVGSGSCSTCIRVVRASFFNCAICPKSNLADSPGTEISPARPSCS